MTARQAAWVAAAVACLVYANAVRNGWSGDDILIVLNNSRAHSVGSALGSWFHSYWPEPYEENGLYRPLVILSFGIEWGLSAGEAWLFHLDNVLLHAAATALAVGVALQWLPPMGALAAGLLFAVHPVHVEAVSTVVGRAELLAAVGLLSAVLAARRFRQAADAAIARAWLAACVAGVVAGLLSKEHAAIAVAALALDQVLDPAAARRPTWALYVTVITVTGAWLFLWNALVGGEVASGATAALYGLPWRERFTHMMPAQLDVVRLLTWPVDLAADYSPMTIPLRTEWGTLAWVGFTLGAAVVSLGLAAMRRAPPIAFGILFAAGSYLPTSNLLFPSGVVLAERALYLAALAPALVFGWAVARLSAHPARRLGFVAAGLALVAAGARSFSRTPYWKDAATPIIGDLLEHPENYRSHIHAGDFLFKRERARQLAAFLTAAALAPHDPLVGFFTVRTAIHAGRFAIAIQEARRVHALAPDDPRIGRWMMQAFRAAGMRDSAVVFARRGALRRPSSIAFVHTYQQALAAASAPKWRVLLADVADDWLSGRLVQASARLDSLAPLVSLAARAPTFCDDLGISIAPVRALSPHLADRAREAARSSGRECSGGPPATLAK